MITLFLIKYLDFLEPPVPPYFLFYFLTQWHTSLIENTCASHKRKGTSFLQILRRFTHFIFRHHAASVVYNVSDFRFFQLPTTNLALPARGFLA